MKKILYILFLITSSVFANSISDTSCYDSSATYVKTVFVENENVGCLNPSYYSEGSEFSCSGNSISEDVYHWDSSHYCSNGYKYRVRDAYTYSPVTSCPSGQAPDLNGICAPIVCSANEIFVDNACVQKCPVNSIYDSESNKCTLNPDDDFDGDGIPNGQDTDSDGDGIPDTFDDYIGQGTSNGQTDLPVDGSALESSSCSSLMNAALAKCALPNVLKFSCNTTSNGLPFVTQNICNAPVDPCISITDDFLQSCQAPKIIHGNCHYNFNTGVVSNTLTCDTPDPDMSPCEVFRHNLQTTCSWPDYIVGNCHYSYGTIIGDNTLHCVIASDNTSNNDNNTSSGSGSGTVDSNSTLPNLNLNPLISANNQNAKDTITHIDKVEKNTRITNDKLTSIDSKLSTLVKNSNNKDLKSIDSKLSSSNVFLDEIRNNTALTANKLNSVNDNLSGIKSSLDSIRNESGTFQDGVNSIDINNINIDTTSLDDTSDYMDNLEDNVAYLTDDVASIKNQFIDLRGLLEGDNTQLQISSGSCSNANLSKFADIISPYSAVFALLTYVSFMLAIFKMIFMYLSRGEN